jgi:hypothetical protein
MTSRATAFSGQSHAVTAAEADTGDDLDLPAALTNADSAQVILNKGVDAFASGALLIVGNGPNDMGCVTWRGCPLVIFDDQ